MINITIIIIIDFIIIIKEIQTDDELEYGSVIEELIEKVHAIMGGLFLQAFEAQAVINLFLILTHHCGLRDGRGVWCGSVYSDMI